MLHPFAGALVASGAAALITLTGLAVIRRFERWGRDHTTWFMSFAAGVLLGASLLHIVPKAISLAGAAPTAMLAGFLLIHLFNHVLSVQGCEQCAGPDYRLGLVPLVGIGLHSFIDGIVYAVTFSVGTFTGLVAAVGMVLHEFPEGIVVYLMLLRAGFPHRQSLLLAVVAAGLTTPLGVLASWPVVAQLHGAPLGVLLGGAAGVLVYVGATHLLPHAEHENRPHGVWVLLAGVTCAVVIVGTHP